VLKKKRLRKVFTHASLSVGCTQGIASRSKKLRLKTCLLVSFAIAISQAYPFLSTFLKRFLFTLLSTKGAYLQLGWLHINKSAYAGVACINF
jgi:hypothetical protein